jgi:hypothetical protein
LNALAGWVLASRGDQTHGRIDEQRADGGYADPEADPEERPCDLSVTILSHVQMVRGRGTRGPQSGAGYSSPRMISEERDDERGRYNLLWALLLSAALHATLLPLAFWATAMKLPFLAPKPPQREEVVSSTAIRIERRTVPQPLAMPRPQARPQPQAKPRPVPRPQPRHRVAPAARPSAPPRELARNAPTASPQPTPKKGRPNSYESALEQKIAQDQQQFSQEAARLNQRNQPLSIVTAAPHSSSTYRRTYFDTPGRTARDVVQAVLIPINHWATGNLSCYYTHYVAQFTNGGHEEGTIPWPVCYPATDDRMIHPPYPHSLPIPVPQPDYVLPAGTYLTPLLREVYNLRG